MQFCGPSVRPSVCVTVYGVYGKTNPWAVEIAVFEPRPFLCMLQCTVYGQWNFQTGVTNATTASCSV
jgi:hypothetical protein